LRRVTDPFVPPIKILIAKQMIQVGKCHQYYSFRVKLSLPYAHPTLRRIGRRKEETNVVRNLITFKASIWL
jgi:hypothetical protein